MADFAITGRRFPGTHDEQDGTITPAEIGRALGTDPYWIGADTLTIGLEHHGRMVVFIDECTVTIPPDLPIDFSCGWAQAGEGQITFAAGEGVTLCSFGDALSSAGKYATGAVACLGVPDEFWLLGNLT